MYVTVFVTTLKQYRKTKLFHRSFGKHRYLFGEIVSNKININIYEYIYINLFLN